MPSPPTAEVEEPGMAGQLLGMLSPPKMIGAATRTGAFAANSIHRAVRVRRKYPEVPVPRPTITKLASVFVEELMLLGMATMDQRVRNDVELARVRDETDAALALFAGRGWDDDPAAFHQRPPTPDTFDLTPAEFARVRFQELSFDSAYEPVDGMPGASNWLDQEANRRCYAHVLEHRDGPRPWLVLLHGFAMGLPVDLRVMRALTYHRNLGFNVMAVVLPLHGQRRASSRDIGGAGLVSLDWVANVHGLTQAAWDVRRCLAWIRARGASSIAIHGMSLGGYTAALVAGLDDDLACVVAGVPAATIHRPLVGAYGRNPELRRNLDEFGLLDERVEEVHRVITPTSMPCLIAPERRFIYAGTADRLTTPNQPYVLWEHWDRPSIHWTQRSHVFTMMSAEVRRFVQRAVVTTAGERAGQLS